MRVLAAAIVLLLAPQVAHAEDLGGDAPYATKLPNGSLLLNPAAVQKLDVEVKRLQGVERLHKEESWAKTVLISVVIGLAVGVAVGAAVAVPATLALK